MTSNRDTNKAIRLFERALKLQREMYDFANELEKKSELELTLMVREGAFEMDTTWNKMEDVSKILIKRL